VAGGFNVILVSGNGSAWNNSGSLALGGQTGLGHHSLTIVAGGVVSDDTARTGVSGGTEAILVAGPGSIWSNRNDLSLSDEGGDSLVISNGGAVYDVNASIGGEGYDNILVTGSGSIWSNRNSLSGFGEHTSVIISNGGVVYCASSDLDSPPGTPLVVTGAGSLFHIDGNLFVGGDESLTVADGGVVCAASMVDGAFITVSGGGVYVTNGLGTATLTVQLDRPFILNSGTLTVDNLLESGNLTFNGGVLNTKATMVNNGSVFTVGDGVDTATFKLDSGGSGFHAFANGLSISSNAMLRGTGTIVGSTVVNGGGVLAPGGSPGSITFSNGLTLAQNSTLSVGLDGAAAGQYDQIVALGSVSVSNSVLSLTLGYTPLVGDSYTIVSNLGPNAIFGTFVDAQGDILTNNASFMADGTAFEISYAGNADGQDVTLTAVVPEPAAWLLTVLGIVALLGGRRARFIARSLHHERRARPTNGLPIPDLW
jgi:T5SS/PEP-CTERM-associated repeat protein